MNTYKTLYTTSNTHTHQTHFGGLLRLSQAHRGADRKSPHTHCKRHSFLVISVYHGANHMLFSLLSLIQWVMHTHTMCTHTSQKTVCVCVMSTLLTIHGSHMMLCVLVYGYTQSMLRHHMHMVKERKVWECE